MACHLVAWRRWIVADSKHPLQPLALDSQGVLRFKENKIVSHLLEVGRQHGCGLNELACMNFSKEDREQFAQLIGYSLSGWGTLIYVSDETYAAAQASAAGVPGTDGQTKP